MLSKRLIAVNLSAAVLMAVMTGCGNTSAPASDPVSEQPKRGKACRKKR